MSRGACRSGRAAKVRDREPEGIANGPWPLPGFFVTQTIHDNNPEELCESMCVLPGMSDAAFKVYEGLEGEGEGEGGGEGGGQGRSVSSPRRPSAWSPVPEEKNRLA